MLDSLHNLHYHQWDDKHTEHYLMKRGVVMSKQDISKFSQAVAGTYHRTTGTGKEPKRITSSVNVYSAAELPILDMKQHRSIWDCNQATCLQLLEWLTQ